MSFIPTTFFLHASVPLYWKHGTLTRSSFFLKKKHGSVCTTIKASDNLALQRRSYSHVLFLNPRLVAFSETARLIWSETPAGNSAVISTLTRTLACGSLASRLII